LLLLLSAVLVALPVAFAARIVIHGVSTRDEPSWPERVAARTVRRLALPSAQRHLANPVPLTPDALAEARMHWADHCALCHGNDGRGQTEIGRNLYPKAPDLTLAQTQRLTDGELLAIIKGGVRLTGMPAWGSPDSRDDRETWKLVHLIRRLPRITAEELDQMKAMNPVSPMQRQQDQEEAEFLNGDAAPAPSNPMPRGKKEKS
jgi:mono/diheme cytochrome c family protein